MEIIDTDGDRLQFLIKAGGVLCEYVNGELAIERITKLVYLKADGIIKDDTGVFKLRRDEQISKALGLYALAMRAGVQWVGDAPEPATELCLTDTDGDKLEFSITDTGKLQEKNNGVVDIAELQTLTFEMTTGTVIDDSGTFQLPANECIEKAAVLMSLAAQAGVKWLGDDPNRPKGASGRAGATLDIENCASDWEYKCPKRWESLSVTSNPQERFCETCKETVYLCTTEDELSLRVGQRRCVAFDVINSSTIEVSPEENKISVRAALLSGEELPLVYVSPEQTVAFLKAALMVVSAIPVEEQRLLLDERELQDADIIDTSGISPATILQLARVKPEKLPEIPRVRMMGKRAPPKKRGPLGM